MTNPLRKPSTALQWHPHSAATESAIIDMANSRQIALRTRLRNFYWLTECKPLSLATVTVQQKKMILIDSKDKMTDADVTEVLSSHYGFLETPEGLTIPELDEARGTAIGAAEDRAVRAGNGGRVKAQKALEAKADVPKTGAVSPDPDDF